eukprot:gene51355-52927_t
MLHPPQLLVPLWPRSMRASAASLRATRGGAPPALRPGRRASRGVVRHINMKRQRLPPP